MNEQALDYDRLSRTTRRLFSSIYQVTFKIRRQQISKMKKKKKLGRVPELSSLLKWPKVNFTSGDTHAAFSQTTQI
jgi:hypothetical protein